MKILLKTTYPCLISNTTEKQFLSENDSLEIEDETFLSVYPLQANLLPFCIDLTETTDSSFYSYLNINNQQVVLLEKQQSVEIFQKETLNFAGAVCKMKISKNSLSFETDKTCIKLKISHKTNSYKLSKIKNFACLQFEKDIYFFDVVKSKLSHLSADKIQLEGQKLSTTKKLHDSLNREKHSIYTINDDIELKQEEFTKTVATQQTKALTPYKFVEGLTARDFKFSIECLSLSLKEKIDDSKLQSFFGTVFSFVPLSEQEFLIFSNTGKKFAKFDMIDEKINDIVVDDL